MSVAIQALISVSNKVGLDSILTTFNQFPNSKIYSTDGTLKTLLQHANNNHQVSINSIESLTNQPEILSGRVKTLHPKVFGGILCNPNSESHQSDLKTHNISPFNVVIANLYPFKETIQRPETTLDEAIENIDIGGVSLIRAAAKNYKHVTVLTDPSDYHEFCNRLTSNNVTEEYRKILAVKAFRHTVEYDSNIVNYLSEGNVMAKTFTKSIDLKYGCNPHQQNSAIWSLNNYNPLVVLNGKPSYINFLDAMNGWQLVNEIHQVLGLTAVASYKHTSPAGVGTNAVQINPHPLFNCKNPTPLATAFIRARGADPLSSFGDFIAANETIDSTTAKLISKEVSDGIIAPSYSPEALEILKKKKQGNYLIFQFDRQWHNNANIETREVNGLMVSQQPNNYLTNITANLPNNVTLPNTAIIDLTIANITLKFTQSNSIVYAKDGQVIGVGAGQQNRVDCVRLAGKKALNWHKLWNLELPKLIGEKRQDKINNLMAYISSVETMNSSNLDFCLASDAFFPYKDSIDVANDHGVKYIIHPGGSIADSAIQDACDQYGIKMITTGTRLFTH